MLAALDLQRVEDNAFHLVCQRWIDFSEEDALRIAESADNRQQSRICHCQRVGDNAFHLIDEDPADSLK